MQVGGQVESDDSLLFNVLVKMYNSYGLSALVKKTEDEVDRSRIVYSRFLGKMDD